MAKDSKRKCPDCQSIDINSLFDKGNGRCSECNGTGHDKASEAIVQFGTLGLEDGKIPCPTCSGTGQCQTCGGTGYESYYEDDISDTSRNRNSDEGESSGFLGKIMGFIIVAAIVIWFVFAVAIPLIIINIAIITLIVGLTKKRWNRILFPISILGAIYIVVDYNKDLFTKTLVNNVSFFDGLIPIFLYTNIIAGLIAAYFLIRDLINKKNLPVENEGEFSKRNLIIMGCLLIVGCLTIGLQKYFDLQSYQQVQSSVFENHSVISAPAPFDGHNIKSKVTEYLQRNMQSSVEYVTSLYSDNVDFYNSGIVDKNFITNDKRNYFSKWPERNITLTSDVDVMTGTEERTWLASFNYHYQVKNTKKNLSGDAWCKLIFKAEGNSLVIISEKGGVYKNN